MINTRTILAPAASDAELVAQSVAGDRDAFGQIVARYQTLICSLAYSATGSLTESEDLSQETFLAAWRQLPELREPGRLRSWLCGILRNLSHQILRRQLREPVHGAEILDAAHHSPAVEPQPPDQIISREEEAILRRSLERIPETYREPLILFYREQKSIERVAQVLDLSEEVVRQRLSRGRKLLQREVAAFVEGALRQSAPGSAFAAKVHAALPINTAGTAAGAGAIKGGGVLAVLTLPIIGLLASLAGSIGILRDPRLPGEHKFRKRLLISMWMDCAGLCAGLFLSQVLRNHWGWRDNLFVDVQAGCYLLWAGIMAFLIVVYIRRSAAVQPETRLAAAPSNAAKLKLTTLTTGSAMTVGALAWLVDLAWQASDYLSIGMAIATGVTAISWCFCCLHFPGAIGRNRALLPLLEATVPTILIVGGILLILNLRLDRWIAVIRGGGLIDAHRFLPMWKVHLATLLFVVWTGVVVSITKPKGIE